jgi:hypothetical protein
LVAFVAFFAPLADVFFADVFFADGFFADGFFADGFFADVRFFFGGARIVPRHFGEPHRHR